MSRRCGGLQAAWCEVVSKSALFSTKSTEIYRFFTKVSDYGSTTFTVSLPSFFCDMMGCMQYVCKIMWCVAVEQSSCSCVKEDWVSLEYTFTSSPLFCMCYFQIKSMVRCVLVACVCLLHSVVASVLAASIFPVADMSLKLSFDLASTDPAQRRSEQQCFPFLPNTLFQGQFCILLLFMSHTWFCMCSHCNKYHCYDLFDSILIWFHVQAGLC